jgi:CHASE2 domain-containing sensor protein
MKRFKAYRLKIKDIILQIYNRLMQYLSAIVGNIRSMVKNRHQWRGMLRFFFHRDHFLTVGLAAAIMGALLIISVNLSFFNPINRAFEDFSMTDIYYEILSDEGSVHLSSNIVIVDVTKLHSRCDFAQLFDQLTKMHPAVIGLDVIFEDLKCEEECNNDLVESLFNVPDLIVASKLVSYDAEKNEFNGAVNSYFEKDANFPLAYVNMVSNMNIHALRKYSIAQRLCGDTVFSFPTMICAHYLHRDPRTFYRKDNEPVIDYSKSAKFPSISADSVQYWPRLIKNRIVLVGCLHEESDTHFTPIGKRSGIEVQAYSIQTILNHRELRQMSTFSAILFGLFISYITAVFCFLISKRHPHSKYLLIKLFLFLEMVVLVWMGFYCYVHYNYNINLLYALLAVALTETSRFYYANIIIYLKSKHGWARVRRTIYK